MDVYKLHLILTMYVLNLWITVENFNNIIYDLKLKKINDKFYNDILKLPIEYSCNFGNSKYVNFSQS